MFQGNFEYTIDAKGRLSIPAKFRDIIQVRDGEAVVVTNWFDGCLMGFTPQDWQAFRQKIKNMGTGNRRQRRMYRSLVGPAVELSWDRQGRVLIPPPLRAHAQLEHQVVIAGFDDRFEVWGKELWEKEQEFPSISAEESEESLADMGIVF
ncbi:MAG: division/cell wall cluster transcriptional repressor MraZ [Deltaproteobacteria bacterium]|nr:division/cell wall cluster transcriptional repressor MraZ [Deltaproteobacteria bacterium]